MTNPDRKPWDRPENSLIPLRPGDRDETPLFTARGEAVSTWEGVQAATSSLFYSFIDHSDEAKAENEINEFGEVIRVHDRAKILRDRSVDFLDAKFGSKQQQAVALKKELDDVLASYRGWAERRNDLAHGYITMWQTPDYSHEEQSMITVYALLPSHARSKKWFVGEPEYNYVASEIENFAREFRDLDEKLEAVASQFEALSS